MSESLLLMNARTGEVVASTVELADTRAKRRRGLLGRGSLDSSSAFILRPCFSIHTAFMQFPIDVVFVDRGGIVVHVVRNMEPWRIAASLSARAVIEMAGGALSARDVRAGDRLYLSAENMRNDQPVSSAMSA